jgi:hypothetical protein
MFIYFWSIGLELAQISLQPLLYCLQKNDLFKTAEELQMVSSEAFWKYEKINISPEGLKKSFRKLI